MNRKLFRSALLSAALCSVAAVSLAVVVPPKNYTNNNAANAKKDGPAAKPEPLVIQFNEAKRSRLMGNDIMVVSGVEVLTGKQRTFGVENEPPQDKNKPPKYDPKERVASVVTKLKQGEYLRIEPKEWNNLTYIDKAEAYTVAEHELEPNVYLFDSSYKDTVSGTEVYKVELRKLAKTFECIVMMVPAETGKDMVADPTVCTVAETLMKGQSEKKDKEKARPPVEATIAQQNGHYFITSLDAYQEQQQGTFSKLTDADVNGQKGQAVEIDQGGKTVTLLIPGKLANKRWTNDVELMAAAKKLKSGAAVLFRSRDLEGKSFLRQLAAAPKDKLAKDDKSKDAASGKMTLGDSAPKKK